MSWEVGVLIAFAIFVAALIANIAYEAGNRAGFRRGVDQQDHLLVGPQLERSIEVVAPKYSVRHFDAYVRQLVFVMTRMREVSGPDTNMVGGITQELWDAWVEPDVLTPVRDLLARRPVE